MLRLMISRIFMEYLMITFLVMIKSSEFSGAFFLEPDSMAIRNIIFIYLLNYLRKILFLGKIKLTPQYKLINLVYFFNQRA